MMRQRLAQRKALDALRAPFRADLIAGHTPNFFRVALEERFIQMPAETVDQEIFQRLLRTDGPNRTDQIAHTRLDGANRAQISQGRQIQLERIVEKFSQ